MFIYRGYFTIMRTFNRSNTFLIHPLILLAYDFRNHFCPENFLSYVYQGISDNPYL